MPLDSIDKSGCLVVSVAPGTTQPPPYGELHCASNFTFLRGVSFPEELVETANSLGYSAIALTDECSLAGVVRGYVAAKSKTVKLIIGSEFTLTEESAQPQNAVGVQTRNKGCTGIGFRIVLLATSRPGYGQLSHLITCARREAPKGQYRIDRTMVEANLPNECLALWIPDLSRAPEAIASQLTWLQRLFPDKLWIAVELLLRGDDRQKLRR
ncbi:MAG: PHP domain-containing protein, partial [Pseudohongiellaceae bacterium]